MSTLTVLVDVDGTMFSQQVIRQPSATREEMEDLARRISAAVSDAVARTQAVRRPPFVPVDGAAALRFDIAKFRDKVLNDLESPSGPAT